MFVCLSIAHFTNSKTNGEENIKIGVNGPQVWSNRFANKFKGQLLKHAMSSPAVVITIIILTHFAYPHSTEGWPGWVDQTRKQYTRELAPTSERKSCKSNT